MQLILVITDHWEITTLRDPPSSEQFYKHDHRILTEAYQSVNSFVWQRSVYWYTVEQDDLCQRFASSLKQFHYLIRLSEIYEVEK